MSSNQSSSSQAHAPRGPVRSCVGCGQRCAQDEVLRCVITEDARVLIAVKGGAWGRSAWLHPRLDCIDKALARGFQRSFRRAVSSSREALAAQLAVVGERKLAGLLRAARAKRVLLVGREAIKEQREEVCFALMAEDSPGLLNESFVAELAAAGKLAMWGTKQTYGTWLNRDVVAIVAVTAAGLASEVQRSLALLRLMPLEPNDSGCNGSTSLSEVR